MARTATLNDASVSFIGVDDFSDLGAAGNLVDAIDAFDGKRGAVLVNVAPRQNEAKRWENGTPFGYFWYQDTLVVSTVDGRMLSLVKKLGVFESVNVMDIRSVLIKMQMDKMISDEFSDRIALSQFRSYDFAPRIVHYLLQGKEAPSVVMHKEDIPDAPHAAWWIDNFGNVKTTLLSSDVGFEAGKRVALSIGEFLCYQHLKDVPDGEIGLIVGGSGIGDQRFLEIVVQGGRASEQVNIAVGDVLLEPETIDTPTPETVQ